MHLASASDCGSLFSKIRLVSALSHSIFYMHAWGTQIKLTLPSFKASNDKPNYQYGVHSLEDNSVMKVWFWAAITTVSPFPLFG